MCLEKEICKKFKEILGKYDLTKDLVGCIDVAKVKRLGDYIDLPDEFWNKLFEKISPPFQGEFVLYHYKNITLAKEILKNNSIQISNLISNEYNDYAEYSEYLKKIEAYHQLVNNEILDDSRNNLLILCFTKDASEYMWTNYGQGGVCFKISFTMLKQNTSKTYPFLRKVYYYDSDEFDFVSEINYFLYKEYKLRLLDSSATRHALYFKRQKYQNENEWRLAFNCIQHCISFHGVPIDCSLNSENTKYFSQIQENSNKKRKYVELKFDNDYPLFKMKIEEVIVDQTVSQNDFNELKKYAKNIKCSYK